MKEKKERNKYIKRFYKSGNGGQLGKRLGISRQRVHQIVHKKVGFWGRLFDRILYFLKDY